MAIFTNRATLAYNNTVTNSNLVVGELVEALSMTKNAGSTTYQAGDTVPYLINIVNTGTQPVTGLTVTDNLGRYTTVQGNNATPLDYVDNTVRYYQNGTLQATPNVANSAGEIVISGINVPANGNVTLFYEAEVNGTAPLADGAQINNTATLTGAGITPITAADTITASAAPDLTVAKALSPTTVTENGEITYTFVIQNNGNTVADGAANVSITDTFDPILNPITVTLDGTTLASPADYTYNTTTGEFATVPGRITVPAATYTQDPTTGQTVTTPGVSVLTVTGTV